MGLLERLAEDYLELTDLQGLRSSSVKVDLLALETANDELRTLLMNVHIAAEERGDRVTCTDIVALYKTMARGRRLLFPTATLARTV